MKFLLRMTVTYYKGSEVVGEPRVDERHEDSRSRLLEAVKNLTHKEMTILRHTGYVATWRKIGPDRSAEIEVELLGGKPEQKLERSVSE